MTTLPAALGGPPAFPAGLPLVRPWTPDQPSLQAALAEVIASGQLTNGPRVRRLEEDVARRLAVDHVVAVSSCTLGLTLVYQALAPNGEVVVPSFTFSASAHAIHWAGATPRWADIEPERLSLDPASAAGVVGGRTRAISATHIYGAPCLVEELTDVAQHAGVPLVLDAAHAMGAMHRGQPVGGTGAVEVFSLSPTKVLVGGEGGLVATNDADLAARIRLAREYGNPGTYDCAFPGLNARMSELHATVALHNLGYLDEAVDHRNALTRRFAARVAAVPGVRLQHVAPGDVSTWKDLTLVTEPEATGLEVPALARALAAEGIDTRRYYHPPIHRQLAYANGATDVLPVTDRMAGSVLSLPLWSHMTPEQLDTMADALLRILDAATEIRATHGTPLASTAP